MNRRTEVDGEGDDAKPTAAPTCPGVRRRETVIEFRRSDRPSCRPAAGGDPPSPPAPFEPLGNAVAAVVLRLRGGFPRIRVTGPAEWEEE